MNKLTLSQDVPLLLAILTIMFLVYLSTRPGTAKFIMWALLIVSILLILFGCSTQRCYPSKKSKDFARITQIHKEELVYYVRARMYRNQYHIYYKCLPDSFEIGKLVNIKGWEKI